ncbi:TIGR00266 family protein [Aerophototrophica crusticola]|uniref:TIGR00266 family protein n=1 Tax=Aerophototrophica crusticola TaxID=1709002 RepID=A0A858R4H7_9PROT|nr:TIGR00266 family protein [Rhodospirillaceae bacterium B3]
MTQWFFHDGETQAGPLDGAAATAFARAHPAAHCWRQGMAEWLPVRAVAELTGQASPWGGAAMPPPPSPSVGRSRADEIDFRIYGQEMQFVEVELDPGESAVAEAGGMVYKDPAVEMATVFGDGSGAGTGGGFMDKLLGAGKRLVTGESLFTTVFTHRGSGKAKVAFAAPYPGTILPLKLSDLGGSIICQKDSFLAAAKGVSIGIHFQRKILTGLFGGEGFIMQRLEGDGWVFAHVGGTVVERQLGPGEVLHVDTGCVAAFTPSVDFDLVQAGGIKTMLFGGEGVFFATLRGPGRVWIQSLPCSRLAGRMLSAAAPYGNKGEGSVLGPLGNLVMGNRD